MGIYIIKKAWSDSLENDPGRAFGYEVIGYVTTEKAAIEYCKRAGKIKKGQYGWAAPIGEPVCKYNKSPLKKLSE